MKTAEIAVVVGSLRNNSLNRRLAQAIKLLAPAHLVLREVPIGALPLYNEDDERSPAPAVLEFRSCIQSSVGVLFCCPEYNRSFSDALKNALDQGSRPYGQSVWKGKPCAIVGIASGMLGTAPAQQHLRNVVAALDMPTLGQPEVYLRFEQDLFGTGGEIHERSRAFLQAWMDAFSAWIERHGPHVSSAA